MEQADAVIAIGYDFVEYAPCFWNPRRDKRIVHIDASPAKSTSTILSRWVSWEISDSRWKTLPRDSRRSVRHGPDGPRKTDHRGFEAELGRRAFLALCGRST